MTTKVEPTVDKWEEFKEKFQYWDLTDEESLKEVFNYLSHSVQEAKAEYQELIMAVGNKYPGETRHQTALRYIRQAEQSSGVAEVASLKQEEKHE